MSWRKRKVPWARDHEYLHPALFSALDDLKSKRILDMGCHYGGFSEELTSRGCEVVGIDIDADVIKLSRPRPNSRIWSSSRMI